MSWKGVKRDKSILKEGQEIIQLEIENSNIVSSVKSLLGKYDPPLCSTCPKRKADRICVNKGCGEENYLKLICGKCHSDAHSKASTKPEIDLEEYFMRVATFINQQKYNQKSDEQPTIDSENLQQVFNNVNKIRDHLNELKCKLRNEIDDYKSPQLRYSHLQDSITKALSDCKYENIQNQLQKIKKIILFEKNKFLWNDECQILKSFTKLINNLEEQQQEVKKTIQSSIKGGFSIPIEESSFCKGLSYAFAKTVSDSMLQSQISSTKMEINGGIIKLNGLDNWAQQFYINHPLDWEKQYKLRFRFSQPSKNYIMVGIMPLSQVPSKWLFDLSSHFFKRFDNCSGHNKGCDRILKGSDLSLFPKNGTQIEMRIDMNESYLDFSDYPEHQHLNASFDGLKLESSQKYVITFAIYCEQSIVIESFEEISSIYSY